MSKQLALLLAVVGVLTAAAGVAMIYLPAAFILLGCVCVAFSLVVEVRDT